MEESISKIKAILLGAVFIALALIAGGIDNDYNEQRGQTKDGCTYQRISTSAEICK